MKKISKAFIILCIPVLLGMLFYKCSSTETKTDAWDYETNYDQYFGFVPDDFRVIKTDDAHSGKFVTKMDTAFPFSLTLVKNFGQLTNKKAKAVEVQTWAKCAVANAPVFIVVSMEYPGNPTPVYYEFFDATTAMKDANTWTKLNATFYLPKTIDPNISFKAFVWNKGQTIAYADDFALRFVE
ncbi:MAG: hypothetical protein JNK61_10765 [Bacteroidia bacterium]|nr:hypothetical protein [Bacteroidia bacterium]